MSEYIKWFDQIRMGDISIVGGKNASLGEMYSNLSSEGVEVPNGFATTSKAFHDFLIENNLNTSLADLMNQLDKTTYANLKEIGAKARKLLQDTQLSKQFELEIIEAYIALCENNF